MWELWELLLVLRDEVFTEVWERAEGCGQDCEGK